GTSPSEPPIATRSAKRGTSAQTRMRGRFGKGSPARENLFSYAPAAMTLPRAQQPRLAPVLPARCARAVTAGLQSVRVTGALNLLGGQRPRLAPVCATTLCL